MLADRFVEVEETGQGVFVLKAVAFFAVGLCFAVGHFAGIDLFEREHWLEVLDPGKRIHRGTAHALGGRIRSDQFRVCLFEAGQFAEKPVVFEVGDFRCAVRVVTAVVFLNDPPELPDFLVLV